MRRQALESESGMERAVWRALCDNVRPSFGAVVAGSTPVVIALPFVAAVLTFTLLVGEKMKGNEMEKAKAVSNAKARAAAKSVNAERKTIATKGKSYTRKAAGQGLLVLAAMGSSMTAGVAGQQLSKGRASGCGPFRNLHAQLVLMSALQ